MKQFTDWIKTQGTAGMLIFMASYVVGAVLFLPASLFTVAAGIAFGFGRGLLLAISSAAIGAAISFLISRHVARGLVEKRLAKNERLKAFDAAIAQEGWKVVLLLRLVPIFPFPIGNYFFGLTKIRFWPFFFATMVGIIPGSALYVYLGKTAQIVLGEKHQRTLMEKAFLVVGLVALVFAVIYLTRVAKRTLQQIEEKSQQTKQPF